MLARIKYFEHCFYRALYKDDFVQFFQHPKRGLLLETPLYRQGKEAQEGRDLPTATWPRGTDSGSHPGHGAAEPVPGEQGHLLCPPGGHHVVPRREPGVE